jgi:hypothetical protein
MNRLNKNESKNRHSLLGPFSKILLPATRCHPFPTLSVLQIHHPDRLQNRLHGMFLRSKVLFAFKIFLLNIRSSNDRRIILQQKTLVGTTPLYRNRRLIQAEEHARATLEARSFHRASSHVDQIRSPIFSVEQSPRHIAPLAHQKLYRKWKLSWKSNRIPFRGQERKVFLDFPIW